MRFTTAITTCPVCHGFRLIDTFELEIPLGLEELVRDALLDVKGFAWNRYRDRLRLPA